MPAMRSAHPIGSRAALRPDVGELAPIGRHPGTGGYRRFAWTRDDDDAAGVVRRRGRRARARPRPRTAPATCGRGGATRTPSGAGGRAGHSARTWTPCPTAARSTARSASCRAFAALDALRGTAASRPARPLGVASFADEEGARFGVACAGSRLLTGALDPDRARALRDADGVTMAEAMAAAGRDPAHLGRRPRDAAPDRRVRRAARRAGPGPGRPRPTRSASASAIWPHGRWRLDLRGRGQPRGHHPAGGPPRPDARRSPRPCSPRARPPRGARLPSRPCGKVAVDAERRQRHPVAGHRLARRPRRRSTATCARSSPRSAREAGGGAGRGVVDRRDARSTPRSPARLRPGARRRAAAAAPAPGTTPASSPRRGSRPRCCSSATRPGSRTRPRSTPSADDCLAGVEALTAVAARAGRMTRRRRRRRWLAEHALLPAGPAPRDVLHRGGRRPVHRRQPPAPPPGDAERLPGVVLPGFANAHSHAFHRALRGRTHDGGGTFWTWRERMYAVAARLDPDSYLALARATFAEMALAGVTARRRVPLPAPRPGRRAVRRPERDGRGAAPGRRARPGIRLTLLDTCYLAGGLTADGHRRWTSVQRRFGDGTVDAWAERVARAAPDAGHCASGRRSTRCGRCRATSIGPSSRAAERPARCTSTSPSSRPRTTPAWRFYGVTPTGLLDAEGRSARGPPRSTPPT